MLRRLLSNNQSQPTNLVAPIEDQPPAETGPTTVEEPREYILLSKMRPHPPSSIPFYGQPQSGYPPCPYPIPTAHLIQSSCWAQLDANPPPPFSFPADEATDFYWPNFIPSTDNFNSNLGFSLIPSLPQIQTVPPQQPPFDHFAQNEKIYADQNGIEKIELVGKCAQKEEEGVEGQKPISKSNVGDKLESPAPSEESGCPQSCPYCNRFQKVGSLRRHMAQCRRLKGIARGESVPPSKRPIGGSPAPVGNEKKPRIMNGNGQPHSPAPSHSSATVDPSDPYECEWCKFNTLYKGNMKRHLISCHRVSMEILQQMQFDVERLRKLAVNRPAKDELPIQPRRDDTKGKGAAAERKDEKEEEFGDEEEEEEREADEEGEEWEE